MRRSLGHIECHGAILRQAVEVSFSTPLNPSMPLFFCYVHGDVDNNKMVLEKYSWKSSSIEHSMGSMLHRLTYITFSWERTSENLIWHLHFD